MAKPTLLITGATGFFGRHLLQLLESKREFQSIALLRKKEDWKGYDWTRELKQVQLIQGSVLEPEAWENDSRLKGLKGIFHLAAVIRHSRKDPEDMYETNVKGLLAMVRLAAKHRCRLVFVSTSGTVGCFPKEEEWADEESPYVKQVVGSWPYYDSKIQAEQKAKALAKKLGVDLVIIRPPVLLGPGDHRSRATGHILRMLKGKLPFIVSGGMHFVDIRDATQAVYQAMTLSKPRPIYHLTGTSLSIEKFFQMISEIAGVRAPRFKPPPYLGLLLAKTTHQIESLLPKRDHSLLPDPVVFEMAAKHWNIKSRYAQELGYEARDPRQTLADTIRWLRENNKGL